VKIIEEMPIMHRARAGVRGKRVVHVVSGCAITGDSGAKTGKKVIIVCMRKTTLVPAAENAEDMCD
jgi:hypothetical protein